MKFSKEASKRIDAAATDAGAAYLKLASALETFNQELETASAKFLEQVEAYNQAREVLFETVRDERDQFQEEFDNHAEKWQEGERGEAAKDFIDALDTVVNELEEELSVDMPDDVTIDLDNPEELVGNMPRQSDQ